MDLMKRLGAEFFGTFWLVLGGCGSAIFAAGLPGVGIGYLGVSLAFGLTVLTMVYAVGGISGRPGRGRALETGPYGQVAVCEPI